MKTFLSDGITLAYRDEGQGEPILLIHGFASSSHMNWVYPSWFRTLTDAGRRVIAIDNRGHGESEKLYDTALYPAPLMAGDAARLLDHLDIARADVMGYSMGARISAFLCLQAPEKVRSVVFGGLGMGMVDGVGAPEPIARALEAPSLESVTHPVGRAFRQFAENTKSDLKALATCMRASRQTISGEDIARIENPALVAVGTRDEIAGSAAGLAALLPNGAALDIPGRDHMVAVGDKAYKAGVLDFLERRP
ncbi:MAG: alpha/beta fold hydrolase [Pseudomonadota bacterium]